MSDRPLLCLFAKLRQELVREGNVHRMLANAERIGVDAAVLLDDGSTDGTAEVIAKWVGRHERSVVYRWRPDGLSLHTEVRTVDVASGQPLPLRALALLVDPDHPERAFGKELLWKQRMLEAVRQIRPHFVLWMDGDEVFDRRGTANLREFCEARLTMEPDVAAWAFHYTQLWRVSTWARTDDEFDDGWFLKLWRWTPELTFDTREVGPWHGLHQPQFPVQVMQAFEQGRTRRVPPLTAEQVHYGNFGKSLVWKCIQYAQGLGGVDRHLRFERAEYRAVDPCTLPEGAEQSPALPEAEKHHRQNNALDTTLFYPSRPVPFSPIEIARIEAMGNLRGEPEMFTVVVPAYNRAHTLQRTLQSLLDQTYPRWVALVLDDGSTDETPALMRYWQDRDPRIFYARYPENRGGVAINELGMAISVEWSEWWTRLGSDDWFGPRKLELDARALREGHDACYGAYQVIRDGRIEEICNGPVPADQARTMLLGHRFVASWVNCAARTSALQAVRSRWGHFVDPRLRNMEDFLFNARLARVSKGWVWRGQVADRFVIDPTAEECQAISRRIIETRRLDELEALWTCVTTGASGNVLQTTKDDNLTRALITQDTLDEQARA